MHDYCAADYHLCSRYIDSTIPLLPKSFQALAIFYGCTDRAMSDLVRDPKDRLSCDTAHLIPGIMLDKKPCSMEILRKVGSYFNWVIEMHMVLIPTKGCNEFRNN